MAAVKYVSAICYGIDYYDNEAEADAAGAGTTATYNGGWKHGQRCGRDLSMDYIDPVLGKLYAVTI